MLTAKSGGKFIKLEFPKTEIQVYGPTAVIYSDYAYELEAGGSASTNPVASPKSSCCAKVNA